MKNTFLYFHINPIKQEIFNVGIGNAKRPYSKKNRNNWWHNIVNKYGYDVIVIHENLTWKKACELEINYISKIGRNDLGLGSLINLTDGGEGNKNASKETRLKISLANSGKIRTTEQKEKIRNANLGKKASEETKNKMKRVKRDEQFKNNLRLFQTGRVRSSETRLKMGLSKIGKIKIGQYSLNNNIIQIFNSMKDVRLYLCIVSSSNISQVCNGTRKTAYNFIWKYENK
jgi:hypothetical protein